MALPQFSWFKIIISRIYISIKYVIWFGQQKFRISINLVDTFTICQRRDSDVLVENWSPSPDLECKFMSCWDLTAPTVRCLQKLCFKCAIYSTSNYKYFIFSRFYLKIYNRRSCSDFWQKSVRATSLEFLSLIAFSLPISEIGIWGI